MKRPRPSTTSTAHLLLVAAVCATLVAAPAAATTTAHPADPTTSSAVASTSSPDFDGDGYADLAIGALYDDVPSYQVDEGSVTVLYGEGDGLSTGRAQYWHQGELHGIPEDYDQFGFATSWGDFDADGFDDLAVGVPSEATPLRWEGEVDVIFGSPSGLDAAGSQKLRSPRPQYANFFGTALTTADFNGDGFDDLAASSPRDYYDAGAVSIYFGAPRGLSTENPQQLNEKILGLNPGSWFGASVAAGDTNGDGYADLTVGVPHDDIGADKVSAGSAAVIMGSADGLVLDSVVEWSQGTPGVPGEPTEGDVFGVVAMGDLNRDGYDDLVVGAPNDDEDGKPVSSVTVLYGSAAGLTAAGSQRWDQHTPGVPDRNERFDAFGNTLVIADFNGDGADDLAVGDPKESFGTGDEKIDMAGQAVVLYGGPTGLSAAGSTRWNQDSRRIKDVAEDSDHLSNSMTAGDFDGDGAADLVLGVPWEDHAAGVIHVIRGSRTGLVGSQSQLWSQASPGMPTEQRLDEYFGCGMGSTLTSCEKE